MKNTHKHKAKTISDCWFTPMYVFGLLGENEKPGVTQADMGRTSKQQERSRTATCRSNPQRVAIKVRNELAGNIDNN